MAGTFSSKHRDARGRQLLAITLAGAGLLAFAVVAIAPDRQVAASNSVRSREVAAAPASRSKPISKRSTKLVSPREPMMHSASEGDILDEIPEESPAAPLGSPPEEVVAPDIEARIDALAERISDESGPARKAAIQEAMSVVADLPPDDAAVLLARLNRTATPRDNEMHGSVEPTSQGD